MRTIALRTLLFVFIVLSMSAISFAQVRISVAFGPPPIPVYEQPVCPSDGYIWTPGYWAWDADDGDYYWVPGTWVMAPEVGFLWTPPYWAWDDGAFVFYDGYWGPHVGFYGGIDYGFGYFGFGFMGGRWDGDRFFYNRSVTNVNVVNIHNVYNETVIKNNVTVNRVSYNGGPDGIKARPRPEEERAAHERHIPPVTLQAQHIRTARSNPELRSSANHGKPLIAATPRPGEFRDHAVAPAREAGGPYNHGDTAARSGNGGSSPAVHPKDLPPFVRPAPSNTGGSNRDRKYQQEQEKLLAKQAQERQKLQQKQEQEHQRMERQNADTARRQETEQRHQQQTEQLQQRHLQEQQRLQEKKNPNRPK